MKNLSKVLVLVLILSLFTNFALAHVETVDNTNLETVQRLVERTNLSIQNDVERAQASAERIIGLLGNNFFSRRIVDVIIISVQSITNMKAWTAIRIAKQLGVNVGCVYEEYYIGYRWVEIDPLYVMAD